MGTGAGTTAREPGGAIARGGILDLWDDRFWERCDQLVDESELVIQRPRRAPDVEYGELAGTRGGDGSPANIWVGSLPDRRVTGAIMTVDLRPRRRDVEVKLLIGCTPDEARHAMQTHGATNPAQTEVGALLVMRRSLA